MRDGLLVAGNRRGGNDDRIALVDGYGLMASRRDARECRKGFALRPGAHDDHLIGGNALEVVGIDEVLIGDIEVPQFAGDIGVLDHGTARDHDLAPVGDRGIADLLQTVDMARERSDDHAPLRLGDDAREVLPHFPLRGRERRLLRVRGVGEQQIDPDVAEARKRVEVGMHTVDGRLVEFEVARVQYVARRALEKYTYRTWDGVVHGEELGRDASELDGVAGFYLDEFGVLDAMSRAARPPGATCS